ncbi:MAG: hypothetical protein BWY75_03142 [bacterium ADurb.Bin425]|nr:MAG: hypothetical protein BWY75_03142 [bacterium ADurb.Bin425]
MGRKARVTLSNLSVGGKNVFYLAQCREAAARQGCAQFRANFQVDERPELPQLQPRHVCLKLRHMDAERCLELAGLQTDRLGSRSRYSVFCQQFAPLTAHLRGRHGGRPFLEAQDSAYHQQYRHASSSAAHLSGLERTCHNRTCHCSFCLARHSDSL